MTAVFRERAGGLEHMTASKRGGEIRTLAFRDYAVTLREILAYLGGAHQRRAWCRPVARRCGRCPMPGRAASTRRPSQHRTTNSISASRGKNSLTRIRSRSSGTARVMGHQSRLVGHSVAHGQYLRCNSGAVFTRRRHALPESRLLTLLSGCGLLAEVALDLYPFDANRSVQRGDLVLRSPRNG